MVSMYKLAQVTTGKIVNLISSELDQKTRVQMSQLGLIANTPVKVLANSHNGPLLVLCQSSKIMVSRKVCQEIEVSEV